MVEYDKDGDPIHDREASKGVFNPNEYILSNENLVILGGETTAATAATEEWNADVATGA